VQAFGCFSALQHRRSPQAVKNVMDHIVAGTMRQESDVCCAVAENPNLNYEYAVAIGIISPV
jgi:hypothetical protein